MYYEDSHHKAILVIIGIFALILVLFTVAVMNSL